MSFPKTRYKKYFFHKTLVLFLIQEPPNLLYIYLLHPFVIIERFVNTLNDVLEALLVFLWDIINFDSTISKGMFGNFCVAEVSYNTIRKLVKTKHTIFICKKKKSQFSLRFCVFPDSKDTYLYPSLEIRSLHLPLLDQLVLL